VRACVCMRVCMIYICICVFTSRRELRHPSTETLCHTHTHAHTRACRHTHTRAKKHTHRNTSHTHTLTQKTCIHIHTAPRIVTSIDGNSLPASSEAEYTDAPPLLCRVGEYTCNIQHNIVHVRNSDILEQKLGPIILMYRPRCVGCEKTRTT